MSGGIEQLVEFMRTAHVVRALYVGRKVRLTSDMYVAGTVLRSGSVGNVVDVQIDVDSPLIVHFQEAPDYVFSPNIEDIVLL